MAAAAVWMGTAHFASKLKPIGGRHAALHLLCKIFINHRHYIYHIHRSEYAFHIYIYILAIYTCVCVLYFAAKTAP